MLAAMKLSRAVAQARLISLRMSGSEAICPPASRSRFARRCSTSFREDLDRRPKPFGKIGDLRPTEELALERGEFRRKPWVLPGVLDQGEREAIDFAAQRVVRVGLHLLEEGGAGGDDLVQEVGVRAIEPEQSRKLVADFLAQQHPGFRLVQSFSNKAQDVVEDPLVAAVGLGRELVHRF